MQAIQVRKAYLVLGIIGIRDRFQLFINHAQYYVMLAYMIDPSNS